jgi:hypothetical protein
MISEVWRDVRQRVQPLAKRIDAQQHRIELKTGGLTGGLVEMWSLQHPDRVRGRRYQRVVIDEAAMVRDLGAAWRGIIRPTLSDLGGDAWLLSTPKGHNFFRECFLWGQQEGNDWRSWQMPTASNPHIPPEEITAARRELPERVFAQEYEAQFLDEAGGVFRRVRECATAARQEAAQPGHGYVAGVDWARAAGGDYTVFVVLDSTAREMVYLDRFSGVDYALQVGRLKAMYERFRPTIFSELNNMGGPVTEMLQREGYPLIGLTTTNGSKAQWVDALALALERSDLALLDDPLLLSELLAYEATRLPSGLLRYAAPPGQHDDMVSALLLAWQGCMEDGPLVLW